MRIESRVQRVEGVVAVLAELKCIVLKNKMIFSHFRLSPINIWAFPFIGSIFDLESECIYRTGSLALASCKNSYDKSATSIP